MNAHSHSAFITALGGASAVAKILGHGVTYKAAWNWHRQGVPWRFRHRLAMAALERGVAVPADFLIPTHGGTRPSCDPVECAAAS